MGTDRPLEDMFFSAVSEAEWRYGAAILPAGRRRESLVSDIERMLRDAFEDRILRGMKAVSVTEPSQIHRRFQG